MNSDELVGRVDTHIVDLALPACRLHAHALRPFLSLRKAASRAGIDLTPVSGFRDFSRQLSIWNGKYSGSRPMQDSRGQALTAAQLAPDERIDAILLWSALPGASRHHWGTDIDLIDQQVLPLGVRPGLTLQEFGAGGLFAPLADWLEANAARHGFFRPFKGVRSGVQSEPWHWSFAPCAEPARRRLTLGLLRGALQAAPLEGKNYVLARLEELHHRYVLSIDPPG